MGNVRDTAHCQPRGDPGDPLEIPWPAQPERRPSRAGPRSRAVAAAVGNGHQFRDL